MAERPPNTPSQTEGLQRRSAGQKMNEEMHDLRTKLGVQASARAQRNETDEMVKRALRRGPGTVKQLAQRTMLSKNGVQKSLHRLREKGDAVREPGAGREPDVWSLDRC